MEIAPFFCREELIFYLSMCSRYLYFFREMSANFNFFERYLFSALSILLFFRKQIINQSDHCLNLIFLFLQFFLNTIKPLLFLNFCKLKIFWCLQDIFVLSISPSISKWLFSKYLATPHSFQMLK